MHTIPAPMRGEKFTGKKVCSHEIYAKNWSLDFPWFFDWAPLNRPRGIRFWLVFLGILHLWGSFLGFSNLSDKYVKNTNDTSFRGKKMRRFRKWQVFLRILHLWGSFRTLMTSICKIQMIQVFGVKKCGESAYDKYFWKFWVQIRILHAFLHWNHVLFVFYIYYH